MQVSTKRPAFFLTHLVFIESPISSYTLPSMLSKEKLSSPGLFWLSVHCTCIGFNALSSKYSFSLFHFVLFNHDIYSVKSHNYRETKISLL